jgi:UDP-N-acetylmuramate--alanine ligase
MIPHIERRVVTYGLSRHADYRATAVRPEGLNTWFRVHYRELLLGEVRLGMPGLHNVTNALGAIATAMELEVAFTKVAEALDGYTGVQRRFTVQGEARGVTVVDDYGHHPVEIVATLEAAGSAYPDCRIVAVFQPHRYSRLSDLWDDFCAAFNHATEVVVCPVYAAGEPALEGVDAAAMGQALRDRGHRNVAVVDNLDGAVAHLRDTVSAGDVVITLGAGDVYKVCDALLAALGAE